MPFAHYKASRLVRILIPAFLLLSSTLVAVYALGGCSGLTNPSPSAQSETPISTSKSPTSLLPTAQPTSPLPPKPESTGPRIPTPEPTLEPTVPPPPPTFTPYPTFTRPPTPTPAVPFTLIDPVAEPKGQERGVEWFASTAHTMQGVFLGYWKANGGAAQFGYPLTEEFVEVSNTYSGTTQLKYQAIQYLEHAVFAREAEPPDNRAKEKIPETPAAPQAGAATQVEIKVEAQLGISGTQMLQQNGYASGRYPLFGYASDFSWVSGVMEFYEQPLCLNRGCGCSFLSYDNGITAAQLTGGTWWSYANWQVNPNEGSRLVVFGHSARADEQDQDLCVMGWPKETHLYIVEHAQINRAP